MKADWSQRNLICSNFRAMKPSHINNQGKMASGISLKCLKTWLFSLPYSLFFFFQLNTSNRFFSTHQQKNPKQGKVTSSQLIHWHNKNKMNEIMNSQCISFLIIEAWSIFIDYYSLPFIISDSWDIRKKQTKERKEEAKDMKRSQLWNK